MDELRRRAYLDALGIEGYVSRRQLPGAPVSRRLAIPTKPRAPLSARGRDVNTAQATVTTVVERPLSALVEPRVRGRSEGQPASRRADALQPAALPRFSLVTIVAGDWLWLEELGGMPLTTEQVQLVQSMASALLVGRGLHNARHASAPPDGVPPGMASRGAARPDVMQFDWPIHENRQLDQGEAAAQAGVAGFLARRLEQLGSQGLVLLGQGGAARVPMRDLDVVVVSTASSAEMLAQPALKRQAWRDLQPLIRQR
jgi:hypothetical protein